MINVPILLICFGLPLIAFNVIENTALKILFSIAGFTLGISISWFLWGVLVTKWRLWAFNQVKEDDWHKLKELAIVNKLIWDDGSEFESREIRTNSENEQIIEIAERINQQEQIVDIKLDLKTPKELRFKFNKKEIIAESISKIVVLVVVVGLFLTNQIIMGLILLGIILLMGDSYKLVKHAFNTKDYLIINDRGVRLHYPEDQFISWEDIDKVAINVEQRKMIFIKIENDKVSTIDCELWRFNIKDYRKFRKQVKVFIDRFIYE